MKPDLIFSVFFPSLVVCSTQSGGRRVPAALTVKQHPIKHSVGQPVANQLANHQPDQHYQCRPNGSHKLFFLVFTKGFAEKFCPFSEHRSEDGQNL